MKRFNFRLERVLQYRELVKDDKRRVLRLKMARLRDCQEWLSYLENERLNLTIGPTGVFPVEIILQWGFYCDRLKCEIEKTREVLVVRETEVDEAMDEYIEASKEVSVLEKLREKRRAEYVENASKEESKVLDELAVQRSGRIRSGLETHARSLLGAISDD